MTSDSFRLLVEPLDLGPDVRAISLELVEENGDAGASEGEEALSAAMAGDFPARGKQAAAVWAAALPALAGDGPWALDFFSHLDRLRDYCRDHGITWRQAAARCAVISDVPPDALAQLLARFEAETFGFRAGALLQAGDAALEGDLARRGVDAYHHVYGNYLACGVCDFENGSLTLLSETLSSAEVGRRLKAAMALHSVRIERPE
jgi:hypothetical protein